MKLSLARKFLASFLLIPSVLWSASQLIGPNTDHGSSVANQLKDLQAISAHKSAYLVSNILFLAGAILLLLATYGIVHVYRGRKLGVGQVAGGLLAIGSGVFFGWYAFGSVSYEMVNHAQIANPSDRLAFAELMHLGQNGSSGAPLFITAIAGIILGTILLGVAMIRRRNVPLWAGVLTLVSGPLSFFLNGNASVIGNLVMLVALAPLALLIWRMTDEEWDAPREIAGMRRKDSAQAEPPVAAPAPAV